MTSKKTNKQALIETTARLFMQRGYHNTSISDIAEACNLRKASVYHYIASKQDLCLEVIVAARNYFRENLFTIVYDTSLSETERYQAFFGKLLHIYHDSAKGCLMGTLGLEVSGVVNDLEKAIRQFFDECIEALATLIRPFVEEKEALPLASDLISQMQGAIMLGKIYRKRNVLIRLYVHLTERLGLMDKVNVNAVLEPVLLQEKRIESEAA